MRIRHGFVSNSSTTSFCIYGTIVTHTKEVRQKAQDLGLEVHRFYGQCSGNTYVGISYHNIRDDETGRQFKDRIDTAVEQLDPQADTCGHCEQAWYDG